MSETSKRFWAKVRKGAAKECWPWEGARDERPKFFFKGRPCDPAVVAWVLRGRKIRPGERIYRTCEEPLCVNPAHLEARIPLDDISAQKIRRMHGDWYTIPGLAFIFDVPIPVIERVLGGEVPGDGQR